MTDLIKVADWSGNPQATIVFVHGLGGHPYDTWRRLAEDDTFWPLWLAEDIPGIDVFTLGYEAPPTNWLGTAMPLQDRVNNIRVRLLAEIGDGDDPIVFITHSLGGLIVKQLLLDLNQLKERNPKARQFLDRTRQVVFLATPHTGSRLGTLVDALRFLARPSLIARVLVANDPNLRHINVSYRDLADDRRATLEHLVMFETQGTTAGRIVDEASADPGLPGERPIGIAADHIFIAKPENRKADQYVFTRNLITKIPLNVDASSSLSTYPLPDVKIQHPSNLAPNLIRLAAIAALAGTVILVLGVHGGATTASCGSNAQSGWIFGSSVNINVEGSTLNCP